MTLNQYLRAHAAFLAEIAEEEREALAQKQRNRDLAARSFAERARLARLEREAA